jgi:hypothetical protein
MAAEAVQGGEPLQGMGHDDPRRIVVDNQDSIGRKLSGKKQRAA